MAFQLVNQARLLQLSQKPTAANAHTFPQETQSQICIRQAHRQSHPGHSAAMELHSER